MSLVDLINEILDDEPINHCADEGDCCAFCGAEYNHALAFRGLPALDHDSDCWMVRAADAVKSENS